MNVLFVDFVELPELFVFILQFRHPILQHLYVNLGSFLLLLLLLPVRYLLLFSDVLVFNLRCLLVAPVPAEVIICVRLYIRQLACLRFFLLNLLIWLTFVKQGQKLWISWNLRNLIACRFLVNVHHFYYIFFTFCSRINDDISDVISKKLSLPHSSPNPSQYIP